MAKKKVTSKRNKTKKTKTSLKEKFTLSRQQKVVIGSFLFFLGIGLFFAFISFFYNWKVDQSEVSQFYNRTVSVKNWLSKFGASVSHFFIYKGFGVASLIIPVLTSLTGVYLFFDLSRKKLGGFWFWGILVMLWISVVLGFVEQEGGLLAGVIGYESNDFLRDYIGFIGTVLVLAFFAIVYIVVRLRYTPEKISDSLKNTQREIAKDYEKAKSPRTPRNGTKVLDKVEETVEKTEPVLEKTITPTKKPDEPKIETDTATVELQPTINDFLW